MCVLVLCVYIFFYFFMPAQTEFRRILGMTIKIYLFYSITVKHNLKRTEVTIQTCVLCLLTVFVGLFQLNVLLLQLHSAYLG